MSRHWKEKLDPTKHNDWMWAGGYAGKNIPNMPKDNLIEKWVYFVSVCSFTFEFVSTDQIKECLEFYEIEIHPTSRDYNDGEHYWQKWSARLPVRLQNKSNRPVVVKALKEALAEFKSE